MMKNIYCCSLVALLLFFGCDRKKDPILSIPTGGVAAVSMQCPQYDSRTFPEGRVYVLVTDQSGTALTDFKIGNFTVVDNGNPSVLTGVDKVNEPLSVVICMDRSGSMWGTPTTDANTAARQFIDNLGVTDAAAIVDFASEAEVRIGFTTNKTQLKSTIDAGVASGAGLAANELRNKAGRKFIIILTDGNENASMTYTTKESAADEVNKAGVAAHIIGLGVGVDVPSLDYISSVTNGRFLSSPTSAQLSTQFNYILYLMQNLVSVNYRSRENKSIGEIAVFLNYGSLTQSATRKYGS
jgi:uncharacterized protein YegL